MCVLVVWGPQDYRSAAELRDSGFNVIDADVVDAEFPMSGSTLEELYNMCLCGVNVEAILERSNHKWSRDMFAGDYIVATPPQV